MPAVAVDSQGNRIKTDILVSGYIKELTKEYELLIPSPIIDICFLFWFIKVCDEWDKEASADSIEIDGQMVHSTEGGMRSLYGCQSISKGTHSWQIKFITKVEWICIGIIEDKPEILQKYRYHDISYYVSDYGCYVYNVGNFWAKKGINFTYCDQFGAKGTVITMTLDMDQHTLSYKINDKDYGIATDKLAKDKYRLIINLLHVDDTIELL